MSHALLHELIKANDTITIFGHVFPDGDCYGSQIGLKEAIRATYPSKRVYALGSGLPQFGTAIGAMDEVSDDIISMSLALVVDVADSARVEDQRFLNASKIFKIDHHIPDTDFGYAHWIDTSMVAVSEMIATFIKRYDYKITIAGANALALGMITDTGRFLFGNIDATSFETMAELTRRGADIKGLYDILYRRDINRLRFESHVFANYKTTTHGLIYCRLMKEDLDKFNLSAPQAASNVNMLGQITGYPIWAFFAHDEHNIRCELRSSGPDVQAIAAQFGGGGHHQASGCRVADETILNQLIETINDTLRRT